MPYESSSDPMCSRARSTVRVAAAAACVALVTGVAVVACAGDAAPSSDAGMRIYVDPHTGEIIDAPPAEERARARSGETVAPSTTDDPEPVVQRAPGGGVMIDMGDRQQHEMRVTVGKDGAASTRCLEPGNVSGTR